MQNDGYKFSFMHMKLDARELRELKKKEAQDNLARIKRHPIYFILENIYDTYNIGGLFRLADAVAVEKIYLCGETEIPPNPKIKKASIGTYKVVPWEYKKSAKEVIEELKHATCNTKHVTQEKSVQENHNSKMLHVVLRQAQVIDSEALAQTRGDNAEQSRSITSCMLHVVAVEQHPKSIPYTKADYKLPLTLIFGNETYGVLPKTLELADQIVEIPMWGVNKSLNVIVSAAIVSYWVMSRQ